MVDSLITLFDSTETEFTSNGLGTLSDAIACIVSETRNGEYELEMEYPIKGRRFNDLSFRRIIFVKPNPYDDAQPFRIYSISKPINGIVTINAEHISYDLSGYPVSAFSAGDIASVFQSMQAASVYDCPFIFTTDKTTQVPFEVKVPSSMRSILGGTENSILSVYGGEYEFNRYLVTLHNHRGRNRGVSIRYGKNLTDFKQEENCQEVYTGVYPYWVSEQDGLFELPEKTVEAEGEHNYIRIYPLDLSQEWENQPTEEQMRERAMNYITSNNIGVPKVSLTVSFAPLSQTNEYKNYAILETVHLCDTVNVYFPEMNVSATAKCIKTEYDAISGKYLKIELGNEKSNLSTTILEQAQSISKAINKTSMERSINNATQLISGGLGGYVLLHSSTNGDHPDEILIMDTDDIMTATKVWRWNKNGLGYSSTGYNGDYGTAITMDGAIVADFITVGILDGTLLRAGSVMSGAISQEFKADITDEINTSVREIEQSFTAADGVLRSEIRETNQQVDDLNESFANQYSGGINKILNSSGVNDNFDAWSTTGTITTEQSEDTLSGSLFRLKSGTLEQEISVIPGKAYVLTFKASRQTDSRCYACVIDNGVEHYIFDEQSVTDWVEYSYQFTANSDSIVLRFGTDGDYFDIADLMLAEGSIKQHWSPSPEDTEAAIDGVADRITNAETAIQQNANAISLRATKTEVQDAVDQIELTPGPQGEAGEDATTLRIDSSRGTVFKNNTISTVLTVTIFKGSNRIEDLAALRAEFGTTAHLEWQWLRLDEDRYGVISATDPMISNDGFVLTLTADRVDTKVTFRCNLII